MTAAVRLARDAGRLCAIAFVALFPAASSAAGQGEPWQAASWRAVGPAITSGRIVDIAVPLQDRSIAYVAAASGGIFKTANRGTTWTPVFDDQPIISIGAIAIAPSNPDVLYAGTGEANNQRSSYWGDGVWRSGDAGRSWTRCGLRESHHIGRIAIDPRDENRFYVAVPGRLYSRNPERGLYRSRDGGATFELVLAVDDATGAVDVAIDHLEPDRIYAATYQRLRRPHHFTEGGPGSRIYRSADGGDTWTALEGGLPGGVLGRIGLDVFRGDPRILYATVENLNPKADGAPVPDAEPSDEPELDPGGHRFGDGAKGDSPSPGAEGPDVAGGEVYRSGDGGDTWVRVNQAPVLGIPGYYYGQIRIDPADPDKLWLLGVQLFRSEDGGATWKTDLARNVHVDHHALWLDPVEPGRMLLGNDGGLAQSCDGGRTWDVFPNLPVSQFYAVGFDRRKPYRIYGGMQDNGTWGFPSVGPSRRGIENRDAYRVNGGDGFYVATDPEDPDIVYSESQFGNPSRLDLRTMERKRIRPPQRKGEPKLRFNWSTPMVLSPHNPRILYIGSQKLHRSLDRGDSWEDLSGDLTTNDPDKLAGNVPHCTITTIAESPARAGVIWVGTDDGRVHVTHDGGRHFRDVTPFFPEEVRGLWVSRIEACPEDRARAFVSFTGYREDRFEPWLFATDDYGGTWSPRHEGLPQRPVNVIRIDPVVPSMLYAGTEGGVWFSEDDGGTWHRLGRGMPNVPVHDLAIQPDAHDLIAGTHGRGIYVLNLHALRELQPAARAEPFRLGLPRVVPLVPAGFDRGWLGAKVWRAAQPATGALFPLHLRDRPGEGELFLDIADLAGDRVARVRVESKAGCQEIRFGLVRQGPGRGGSRPVEPGIYTASLTVGGETQSQRFHVTAEDLRPALQQFEHLRDLPEDGLR